MSVENKGWKGGDGSLADEMFEQMWGMRDQPLSSGNITEGPLAQFPDGYDPVFAQREMTAKHASDLREKTSAAIGTDNNPDSSQMPGGNRVIQQDVSGAQRAVVQQTPEDARQGAADTKKDKSPSKGSRGDELMNRIRAMRSAGGDDANVQTTTKSVGGGSQAPAHNLQVQDSAPVPKELDPGRRVGNLADGQQKSSWTGSGPMAALHDDYSKVGELLSLTGAPPCPQGSFLWKMAAETLGSLVKEASGSEYLARNDVHPLKLVAELEDTLGDEWSTWEPETIRESIVKEAGIEPSDDVMSKIMAIKIVLRRPEAFYDDWSSMEKISVALNDQTPVMGAIEDVPVEWLSNAVTIVKKLVGDGDFGPEVSKYAAARLYDQGYVVAPPPLRFADEELGQMVGDEGLRKKVILAYGQSLKSDGFKEAADPVSIQVARLMRNHAYVLDRLDESRGQLE